MHSTDMIKQTAIVDMGERVVGKVNQNLDIKQCDMLKIKQNQERKMLKHQQPIFGQLKSNYRVCQYPYKGSKEYNKQELMRLLQQPLVAENDHQKGHEFYVDC
jgi:hypothetical protein